MKKRFSIWVRERGSDHDVELCELDGDPQPTITALYAKRLKLGNGKKAAKYDYIYKVENHNG